MKRTAFILFFILLALPSLLVAQTTQPPISQADPVRRPKPRPDTRIRQDLSEALQLIQQNYVTREVNYNDLFKASFAGMLQALDPHSNYFDKKEFDEQQAAWSRSEYYGIGATISDRRLRGDTADTYVLAAFDQSPAFRAGLRYGDRIVEINGVLMTGKPSAEVRDSLRGPRGTSVRVTFERASTGNRETFEIIRDAVSQPTVPDAYMLRSGLGYIDMTRGFNRTTSQELIGALENLKAQGMNSLVLDLRNNGGGFVVEAVKIADQFLSKGQIILDQRGTGPSSGGSRVFVAQNPSPESLPLVVLINRASASAAEILAGALQDQDRAFVVGEKSFGKGLVQTIYQLEHGSGLTLTTARYHTPSGRVIQRDYTNTGAYHYLSQGGLGARDQNGEQNDSAPKGPASRTAAGRLVYGGGITPDQPGLVKPRLLSVAQQRLIHPVFGFVRELVNGRVAGFEALKVTRMPDYVHNLQASDLNVDDRLFKSFKDFIASKKDIHKFNDAQLEREREFIKRQLRYDLAIAGYGTVKAQQVLISDDPQVLKAIELIPNARELSRLGK